MLLTTLGRDNVEIDRMRIWDFYFVFPLETKNISMTRDLWSFKGIPYEPNTYEELVDPQRVFDRMKPFQLTAYKCLAACGLIDSEELTEGRIKMSSKTIPTELGQNMQSLDEPQEHAIKVIAGPLSSFPLSGPGGLKARTRLLDFKYDPS